MVALAKNYGRGPASLTKIAQREKIPFHYLERIVASLKGQGLVQSVRGAAGGYLLGKSPARVKVGEIVGVLEKPWMGWSCVICQKEVGCGTKIVWERISHELSRTLNSLTLKDLIGKN